MLNFISSKIRGSSFNPNRWFLVYWLKSFIWIYKTPFKKPKIKVYFGKITKGTPYFLPRRLKKISKEERLKRAQNNYEIYLSKPSLKLNSKRKTIKDFLPPANEKMFVPRKFGINLVPLGWKTKFDDIRFEYNPAFSFVAFKKQLYVEFSFENTSENSAGLENECYWEAALFYRHRTPEKESTMSRLVYCVFGNDITWMWTDQDNNQIIKIDYYNKIIKNKYLHDS